LAKLAIDAWAAGTVDGGADPVDPGL